ncbi:MAG: ABC transporter permease [Acidobacteria bacterium]|nr:ABC transporter permease [Acidobacteriota bacterium]MCW5969735.1 ABC transporter permease [Blastocatellales bacterium]
MSTLLQDIRYGFRRLGKSPGFTIIAVVSLALGIGANTAIFSLVNTILLRPFPIEKSDRVVALHVTTSAQKMLAFSWPSYVDFRDRNEVLSGMFVTRFAPMSLSRSGANERVWGYLVSGNYFDVLGVRAALGRTFLPEEDRTRLTHPVAVISWGCWQRRFGADPEIVGRDVLLNGHQFKIVGVAPDGFKGIDLIYEPEIWAPMMMLGWIEPGATWLDSRTSQNLFGFGRLRDGVDRAQAEASLNLLASQIGAEHPETEEGKQLMLTPPGLIIPAVRGQFISFAWVMMGTVVLVLLIACTNLASLLLARATERRREIAIRLALGAGRARIIRQLLTESTLLALIGGVCGVGLAWWLIDLIVAMRPPMDFPLMLDLTLDSRVLVFSLSAALLTGVIFGLAPALQSTKTDLVPALKDETGAGVYRRSNLRSALLVAQIAFSLVLLIAAGLVVKALQQVRALDPGFDTRNGLMMTFDLALQGYDRARGHNFHQQALERVRALPGVEAASTVAFVPLSLNYSATDVHIEGAEPKRGANIPLSMYSSIGLDYFRTMRIPLVAGRDFNELDTPESTLATIVNETFVQKLLPDVKSPDEAIGRRFSARVGGRMWQIVGVAKDGKYFNIGENYQPFVYFAMRQEYEPYTTLLVRTTDNPQSMMGVVRNAVQQLDPALPIVDAKTFDEHMGLSMFPARVAAGLLGAFGLVALLLAAIGIYGVTSYSVAQRTREIGIRMALGAGRSAVVIMIVRRAMAIAGIGIAIGLAGAVGVTQLMSAVLYGVSATDPITYAGVIALLAGIVFLAGYVPARRAARVDPMKALRYE